MKNFDLPLFRKPLHRAKSNGQTAPPERFIVKGDLHCHSNFSIDCAIPAEQVVEESLQAGYDFIALTEHNDLLHLKTDLSTKDLLVIAGYELTTPVAHINVFGLRSFSRKSAIYTKEALTEYLAYLRQLGGIFQLNHPNDQLHYSHFGYDLDFDFLEIVNKTFSPEDQQTLQDYQTLLCQGRKLVATGGSDTHQNHRDRKVFNCVAVTAKTEAAILTGLAAGHNYVTVEGDGPLISLSCDDAIMGDTVAYRADQNVTIRVDRIAPGTIIRIYTSEGLTEETYPATDKGTYSKEVSTRDIQFCRVELWFDQQNICAYSNPIYIQ